MGTVCESRPLSPPVPRVEKVARVVCIARHTLLTRLHVMSLTQGLLFACVPSVLQRLRDSADDAALHEEWFSVKAQAKKRAAAKIESLTGIKVNPNALFDVQVGPAGWS